ncbi:hypothetical protein DAPPUDRAFT_266094 [Daphnia pulex]|uniref:Uncharacterized protein n=1 Tax=Daphnia pulex TaxID=6669 RepID=E9HUH1_DAPPU|nr:hypothetical protein DAPPUDRAFT_266094 [Daphnia pulex]|eukprot:EFX64602.1 hypothetical protein DAPPUDRAFT_266094 [Daphnia pulex]
MGMPLLITEALKLFSRILSMERSLKMDPSPSTSASEHPPKRRKLNSLLSNIENKDFDSLKTSVKNGADVKSLGSFHWIKNDKSTRDYEDVPCLFAAIISDQPDVIKFLARYHPHFNVSEENFEEDLMKMVQSNNLLQLSNVMELTASACVMLGEEDAIEHGALLWKAALFFRRQINATKVTLKETSIEEMVFKQETEVTANIDLVHLEEKKSVYLWKLQGLIITKRVSTEHGSFPNKF